MSLHRDQGNHSHILTILVLLLCFLSSEEEEEEEENWISISDVGAIRECSEPQMRKYPSSRNVET